MTKGIILAGGTGSRLGSLSKVVGKHLLPIGPAPMIFHPISQLLENNIQDICIVSGLMHLGLLVETLGSGSKWDCSFTYKVQDVAGGIAEALMLCKNFANNENIVVLLGDNIFGNILDLSLPEFAQARLFLKKVSDPERFGIAEVDHLKRLIDIEEKPENPKSNLAITGAYIYSSAIWDALLKIKRSLRGELEISDANKILLKDNIVDTLEIFTWWSDAGTQTSFKSANNDVWNNLTPKLMDKILYMTKGK
jgi:glucose-1-phosphate thymidylyltransferase